MAPGTGGQAERRHAGSTASDLVFYGDSAGISGGTRRETPCWLAFPNGLVVSNAPPITYEFEGKQFIAVAPVT